MVEPEPLRRGKAFQRLVQADFERHSRDGRVRREAGVSFADPAGTRRPGGRADILITELGDFVALYEIKATDWDRIAPHRIKPNLWRHQRQLFSYVETFVELDGLSVCLGLIYPEPPRRPGLRAEIEAYLEDYGVPAYWFSEIRNAEETAGTGGSR